MLKIPKTTEKQVYFAFTNECIQFKINNFNFISFVDFINRICRKKYNIMSCCLHLHIYYVQLYKSQIHFDMQLVTQFIAPAASIYAITLAIGWYLNCFLYDIAAQNAPFDWTRVGRLLALVLICKHDRCEWGKLTYKIQSIEILKQ